MRMGFDISNNEALSRYEIQLDGVLAGFATYVKTENSIDFSHTEIDPTFGGKGVGSALVEFALGDAKGNNFEVVPNCPFVAHVINMNPTKYLELVSEAERPRYNLIT